MAVTYLAAKMLEGLSTDTKPANVPENSQFYETDTRSSYVLKSGTWTLLEDYTYDSYKLTGTTNNIFYAVSQVNNTDLGSGAAITANFIYTAPMIITKKSTIDTVGTIVTTGVASAVIRFGCYADNGSCYPGALVADFGTVSAATSSTAPSITASPLPLTLNPGLYWFATLSNSNPQLKTVTAAGAHPIWGLGLAAATVRGRIGTNVTFTYGALPDPHPAGASGSFSQNWLTLLRFV